MKEPLYGLRVIDLGRVWSGPLTTRILADFGAEVIKVESLAGRGAFSGPAARQNSLTEDFPGRDPGQHPWNRSGMFNDLNRNKLSLTLDLSQPEGVEIFKKLVLVSNIVVENYTPRVMTNFGLDYVALKKIKPDIIMLSMPAYGMTGPYHEFPGYGNTIEPVAGLTDLTGYYGEQPVPLGMIAGDVLAALHGVSALLTALWSKNHSGEGQYIDLSQAETQTSIIGESVIGFQMTGREPERIGNRHSSQAPHGCYRCKGEDDWVVISIASDEEWNRLCLAMGETELASDIKYSDQLSRWQNQSKLDEIIQRWTMKFDHVEVMQKLQHQTISCGPVFKGKEILSDRHLLEKRFFVNIAQKDAGIHRYAGNPIKLSKSPATFTLPAPLLGEHNQRVLNGLLGLDDAAISNLIQKGIIGDRPPDAAPE